MLGRDLLYLIITIIVVIILIDGYIFVHYKVKVLYNNTWTKIKIKDNTITEWKQESCRKISQQITRETYLKSQRQQQISWTYWQDPRKSERYRQYH